MSLLSKNLDFTDRDFDSYLARLQNLARSVFPDWTDFNTANFGNILLELMAFIADNDSFYMDNIARESRILTVSQRRNMIALGKLINFEMSGAAAASASLDFTLGTALAGDLTIPQGTIIRTQSANNPIAFELQSDVVILAGLTFGQGTAENSEEQSEVFLSTGLADQEFPLGQRPFIDNSLAISAGNGAYTEVDNFLDSAGTDRHFTVLVDQNDRATVRFGDGNNGAIPTGSITFTYKTGGGAAGLVDPNTITEIQGSFTDILGNPATLTTTNPLASSGGINRQTIAQARLLAPQSLKTLTRTVSRDDFENGARLVPGVARALMQTSNEDIGVTENTGDLYIIATGGGVPSAVLKDAVLVEVTETKPSTLTFQVTVKDPLFKVVAVDATVFLTKGASAVTVKAAIEANLATFFAVSNPDGTPNQKVDFGFNTKKADGTPAAELAWSDVFNVVRDTVGVRKVNDETFLLNAVADDVVLANNEFPQLGVITLTNGDTMAPL